MSKVFIEESTLSSIGNAIRQKTGKSELISPGNMPTEIASITTGSSGTGGDDKFISLLDGSPIEEFVNSDITKLRDNALRNAQVKKIKLTALKTAGIFCFYSSAIAEAILPKCVSLGQSAFAYCSALEKVDLSMFGDTSQKYTNSDGIIQQNTFNTSTKFKTLILRNNTEIVKLANVNAFTYTQIAGRMGYIYVPAALIDEYKTATNWATFAGQFRAIEDYPDICGEAAE